MSYKHLFALALMATVELTACNKENDQSGLLEMIPALELNDDTPLNVRIKQLYEMYNVIFKPSFEEIEYTWNWTDKIDQVEPDDFGQRYTPAKLEYVLPLIDSVESWVFKKFPLAFSKKYMPLNILLADTVSNQVLAGFDYVDGQWVYIYEPVQYEAFLATNYVMLAYASERFETAKNEQFLRKSWLSIFMEKILDRPDVPFPTAFAEVSALSYSSRIRTSVDLATQHAFLSPPRTKNYNLDAAQWNYMTAKQDFGDYVAFIIFVPEEEKQSYYAANPNIQVKENLIKDYFQAQFGITLTYNPVINE